MDPTRTVMLRRRFMAEMARRFKALRAQVRDFIVDKDALGLKDRPNRIVFNVQPREFEFQTDANKLTAFNNWFAEQVRAEVMFTPDGTSPDTPWTSSYVESAYKRGLLNAYGTSKEAQLFEDAGVGDLNREQFLKAAFGAPEAVAKVRMLATRAFEQLKGVTGSMGAEMNRILAQSMVDGRGVEAIAREMTARIEDLTLSRAMTIARTEIINAHAEGQLDGFEEIGIDKLGIKAEWSTAGDDRVCPKCAPLEGVTFTVAEARGLIPLHPNCRCAWIPSEVKL
jgi:SPP1 gp7 family putative phage head morphogenesis protein